MPSARGRLGRFGELAAAAHLRQSGYTIVERNWRCQIGEIDLVARAGDQVVFVEVRTRRGACPEESITAAKRRRLAALAESYLAATAAPAETDWRIDVIAVEVDAAGRVRRLEQIVAAVGAE